MDRKIALIGCGLMGSAIGIRLLQCNKKLHIWNRQPNRAEALSKYGGIPYQTPDAAISAADIVILTLADAEAIHQVLDWPGVSDNLSGKIIIQMGTISPQETQTIARQIEFFGAEMLDAPLLGSTPEARDGTLILMIGGDQTVFEKAEPILRKIGNRIWKIGELGQGALVKLALNQLIATLTGAFCLSMGLIKKGGISTDVFMQILRESAVYAPTFDKKLDRIENQNFESPNFPLRHLLKDIQLFIQTSHNLAIDQRIPETIESILSEAVKKELGNLDYSALYELVTQINQPAEPSS